MKYNNVYTAKEENSHRFFQMPKELFLNPKYKGMTSDSKILYTILLDRKELSRENGWIDEYNQVFLLYSRKNMAAIMGISLRSIQRTFSQLNELDLIKELRQGLNKPNRIYICRVEASNINGSAKSAHQDMPDWHSNDTDLNETEKIKRYTITGNGDDALDLYGDKFQERYGREHPTVTEEQLQDIRYKLMDFDCSLSDYDEIMDDYFDNLPPTNDGKIFAFVRDGLLNSPLRRYM